MIPFFLHLLQHHAVWHEVLLELSKDVDASIHWGTPSNALLFLGATLRMWETAKYEPAQSEGWEYQSSTTGIQIKLVQVMRPMIFLKSKCQVWITGGTTTSQMFLIVLLKSFQENPRTVFPIWLSCPAIHAILIINLPGYWKVFSPTRKETSYSDQTLTFASHSKKKKIRRSSIQPGLRGSNLRVGRKTVTFQLFFQSGRAKDLSAPL